MAATAPRAGSHNRREGSALAVQRLVGNRGLGALLAGGGRRLEPSTQRTMEDAYGRDLSGVRVHTDDQAAAVARAHGAQALTVGNDIVFGPDRYAPGTEGGRHLLAHEIAHVVQQSGGSKGASGSTPAAEAEADRAAGVAGAGGAPSVALSMPAGVQCQEEEEEEGFFSGAASWLTEKKDRAVAVAEDVIDDPVGSLESAAEKVEDTFEGAVDTAKGVIDDPAGTLATATSKVEGALDGVVEAANDVELTGFAKGAVDNLYKRGEALVEAAPALVETAFIVNPVTGPTALLVAGALHPEGFGGVWDDVSTTLTGVVEGVPQVIETTGNAFGTLAHGAMNPTEEGIDEKMGSAMVDAILGIADIVTFFEGPKKPTVKGGGPLKPKPRLPDAPVDAPPPRAVAPEAPRPSRAVAEEAAPGGGGSKPTPGPSEPSPPPPQSASEPRPIQLDETPKPANDVVPPSEPKLAEIPLENVAANDVTPPVEMRATGTGEGRAPATTLSAGGSTKPPGPPPTQAGKGKGPSGSAGGRRGRRSGGPRREPVSSEGVPVEGVPTGRAANDNALSLADEVQQEFAEAQGLAPEGAAAKGEGMHVRPGKAERATRSVDSHSELLRNDLERKGIPVPEGHDAHHMVPSKGGGAAGDRCRAVMEREGIPLDTEPNGVPLPRTSMDPSTVPEGLTRHQTMHTNQYYETLADALEAAPPGTVKDRLRTIRTQIAEGRFTSDASKRSSRPRRRGRRGRGRRRR